MSLTLSFHKNMLGQPDVRSSASLPMPIVYENTPLTPTLWEYRVLTVDLREEAAPDAALLNKLGNEGWLLISILDQQSSSSRSLVYYYFVRQKME